MDTEIDSYLSKPDITTRTRRLYTFAAPLYLQIMAPSVDGTGTAPLRVRIVAAEGQSEESDELREFLVLDRLTDDDGHTWDLSGPEHQVLGVWVHQAAIISAQLRIGPWTVPSIRDIKQRCGDPMEPGISCARELGHAGAHQDRSGHLRWAEARRA